MGRQCPAESNFSPMFAFAHAVRGNSAGACWRGPFLLMSRTGGRSHMPLRSGFPSAMRGIDPTGVEDGRWAIPGFGAKNSREVKAPVATIRLEVCMFTLGRTYHIGAWDGNHT